MIRKSLHELRSSYNGQEFSSMKTQWKVFSLLSIFAFSLFMLIGCAHKLLVVGGMDDNGNFQNSADIYDPVSRMFYTPNSTMRTGRMTATATTLSDDTVLIAGGQGP